MNGCNAYPDDDPNEEEDGIKTRSHVDPRHPDERDEDADDDDDIENMAEAAHPQFDQVISPGLKIFEVPPTDISIESYRMVTIQPTTTGINPMEFIIPALDDHVDLNRSYFTMHLRLKKNNGANLVADEKLWVTNNLAHTIIKQIDLRLNGTLISPQSDTYHYKAFLQTLMNYVREEGETVLRPQGWFNGLDFPPEWTANNTDSTTPHVAYNALSANHKAALALSKAETAAYVGGARRSLVFQPHLEAFHTGGILVPGVEIKMKFHFNSPNLFLNGVGLAGRLLEADIQIQFHLCQLRLNPSVYNSISAERHNERELAKYPTVRSEIRTFNMVGTLARFDIPNLFQNRIPDRMIVGLLDSRAFNGDVTRDPFCFQKFGLRTIRQMVRGEEYPYETLELNHNDGARDALGYFRFLQASGSWLKKRSSLVRQEDWGQNKNCALFMFDNVANGRADARTLNPKQSGDLQLVLEFGAAHSTNITVLVYAEFENLLEIDSNGAVLYNIYQP